MSVLYADTSALVRAYFADEPEHAELRARLLEGDEPVVSSELTRVEFASAVSVAARAGRLRNSKLFLDRFDADCGDDGPIALLRLDLESVLPLAYRLVTEHDLRTLDALHLAVASTSATELAGGEAVVLVTRDDRQTAAATGMGIETA
ncbi:MAG: type II toxin-antitoxin system VapC family toxin [Candidatus Dormibacteraceae bacterium]